jgi:hypothetical protein
MRVVAVTFCRAGFAGRGMASAGATKATGSRPFRPETMGLGALEPDQDPLPRQEQRGAKTVRHLERDR